MNNHDLTQVEQKLRTARLIAKMMVATVLIGALAIELLDAYGMISVEFERPPQTTHYMLYGLLGFTAFLFIVMLSVRKKFFSSSIDKVFTVSLGLCAVSESLAFSGLMLYMLQGSTANYHLFAGISLFFFYVSYPRLEQWKTWMRQEPEKERKTGLFNRIVKESGNKLVYQRFGIALRLIGAMSLALFLTLLIVAIRADLPAKYYLFFLTMGLPLLLLTFVKGAIEIDRSQRTVTSWWQILRYKRSKVHRLDEFHNVRLTVRFGGQHGPTYAIVLSGPATKVDVYSSRYYDDVVNKAKELADFLNLELVDEQGDDAPKADWRMSLFSSGR